MCHRTFLIRRNTNVLTDKIPMQACSPNRRRLFGANPAVGDEARKGFPPTAISGTTTLAVPALLTQVSTPWRPHSPTQNVFRRIGSGSQPLLYCASAARHERSSFKVLQGLNRSFRRKSPFSTRVVTYWNRLPIPTVTTSSVNSFKRQLD